MNGIRSFVPPTLRTVTLLLMVLMVGVVMMSAQTKTTAPAKKKTTTTAAKKTAKTSQNSTSAGQKVYIDPVTREIVQPTQEQVDELEAAGRQKVSKKAFGARTAAAAEPEEFATESGAIGVMLPEDSVSYAVVTKTKNGKLASSCVDGKKNAMAAMKNNKKPAAAQSEVLDEK